MSQITAELFSSSLSEVFLAVLLQRLAQTNPKPTAGFAYSPSGHCRYCIILELPDSFLEEPRRHVGVNSDNTHQPPSLTHTHLDDTNRCCLSLTMTNMFTQVR